MVKWSIIVWIASAAACGRFQDPNVVVDLRVLAMSSSPPDQVIDVDLSQPVSPLTLLAQLVPTQICALVADPTLERRLAWSLTACEWDGLRCNEDTPQIVIGEGLSDDPETLPTPQICGTVEVNADLLRILSDFVEGDALHGLGGIDYPVVLRVGGEDADRTLDQYATKTVRVAPRIPATRTANTNPTVDHFDATIEDGATVPLPVGRCLENPAPLEMPAGAKLRLVPIEPPGVREVYAVPTLDGKSQTFTESLTYQWIAGDGGFSSGSTGGPRDVSGNPAPLQSDYESPSADDLMGPKDVTIWIIQRDERLGVQWYEACIRVVP
ncbi:MAG: hypothetical protein ABIY55_29720 [Kofleriaceae bacterium]